MKQQLFEQRYQAEWQAFLEMLQALEKSSWWRKKGTVDQAVLAEFPQAYRRLCGQLAIARERHYSTRLIDDLSQLALRGYQQLYRAPRGRLSSILDFITITFPRLVRQEARLFWLCTILFYLPLLLSGITIYLSPDVIYSLFDEGTVSGFESLYRPGNRIREERPADSDVMMFGFYIYNNIGIGFRTFAGGILFAIGTVFILLFNGVYIGAIAGYLTELDYVETFYPFVIAHGAFELTAIVLAGVAGMRLGLALLAPGRHSRLEALKLAAKPAIQIVYGVIFFLLIAAFIEAFWSSKDTLPLAVRYSVGAACWLVVIVYLLGAGRRAA